METLLKLKDISKSYSGVSVLRGINFELVKGEILGLVGENGAGKSTMIKIISGVIGSDSGSIEYFGQNYGRLTPRAAIDLGIATIYQEIDLIDNLTVADNIFLGEEKRNKFGFIDTATEQKETDQMIAKLDLENLDSKALVANLSTAQKQCVQIIKALKNNAKILILDEPTSSLGDTEAKSLLKLVKGLAKRGMGIIYISHFIDEIFSICDKILILKDGDQISLKNAADSNPDQVIHDMIGRDASSYYQREYFPCGNRVLKIDNYANDSTVHGVTLEIKSGEIFGFGGLVGAGRTELFRMIYGADKKKSGKLFLNDREITPRNPEDAISKGIYMISEDRKGEGLFLLRSIKENITVSHNEKTRWINIRAEASLVDNSIHDYEIKIHDQNDDVSSLSGGNQQKTIIARCMMDSGDIYIFDEPTKGVDIGAKEDIYKQILNLCKEDKFVILISSEMPELLSMCDRIACMSAGKLVDIVDARTTSEDTLMRRYLGIKDDAEAIS